MGEFVQGDFTEIEARPETAIELDAYSKDDRYYGITGESTPYNS